MQATIAVGSGGPELPKSVTRVLQHSILQLCNEQIGYSHTLQVLGVLCLTVDDKQQELVVKINNTLKRVNPVTPPRDPMFPPVPQIDREFEFSAGDVPPVLEGGYRSNGAIVARTGEGKQSGIQGLSGGFLPGRRGRRAHGRKQSKPVRVKHVYDEGEGRFSESDFLTVEPENPESSFVVDERLCAGVDGGISHSTPKQIAGFHKAKRKLNVVSAPGNDSSTSRSTAAALSLIAQVAECDNKGAFAMVGSPQSNPKSSETKEVYEEAADKVNGCSDSGGESQDSDCSQRLVIIAPDFSSQENLDSAPTAESGVLNFSMCALNGVTLQPGKGQISSSTTSTPVASPLQELQNGLPGDLGGVRIKEEVKAAYPLGLNLIASSDCYDVSQNLAVHSSFLTDPRFLSAAHASMTNGHATSQNSLGDEFSSTSNSARRYLDEAYLNGVVNGFSVSQVAVVPASYTISNCLKDGLTMHLKKTRAKGRGLSRRGAPMKVKDIVMYDDSAPLSAQRGSKIEGDFMLDSLNVEGRKRRRRTTEDALTMEEIAEYMGSCERAQCSFRCKNCDEVCPDLSRYFNHTLLMHNAFICHQCGKNFTTKSSLLRHRPIHTGMRRFACSICKKSFYRKDKCKAHIKRHLGLSSEPAEKYPPADFPTG